MYKVVNIECSVPSEKIFSDINTNVRYSNIEKFSDITNTDDSIIKFLEYTMNSESKSVTLTLQKDDSIYDNFKNCMIYKFDKDVYSNITIGNKFFDCIELLNKYLIPLMKEKTKFIKYQETEESETYRIANINLGCKFTFPPVKNIFTIGENKEATPAIPEKIEVIFPKESFLSIPLKLKEKGFDISGIYADFEYEERSKLYSNMYVPPISSTSTEEKFSGFK